MQWHAVADPDKLAFVNLQPTPTSAHEMAADLALVEDIGAAGNWLAVVAVARADLSVQASLVNAGVLDDPITSEPCVGLVARGDARKIELMRRSGRATVTFHHGWQWVAVEGPATIIGPDNAASSGIDVPDLLRVIFRAAGGTHDDWDEYDRVMAAERRVAVLVRPARVVTNPGG